MGINSSQPDKDNNSDYKDETTVDDPDDRDKDLKEGAKKPAAKQPRTGATTTEEEFLKIDAILDTIEEDPADDTHDIDTPLGNPPKNR